MRERGEGDFRGARVSRAAAAGQERAAAGGRSGWEGVAGWRPAAGRVERVRLHAPPAGLAGFLFLPGGNTVSPREFGSARAGAHTDWHPHTPERAIIPAAAPAGQTELLQFP